MAINEKTVALIDELRRTEAGAQPVERNDSINQLQLIRNVWISSADSDDFSWDATRAAIQNQLNTASSGFGDKIEQFLNELSTDTSGQDEILRDLRENQDTEALYREYEAFALARYEKSRAGAAAAQADDHWNWDEAAGVWQKYEDGEWKPQVVQRPEGTLALNYERTEWVLTSGPSMPVNVKNDEAADFLAKEAAKYLSEMADFVTDELAPGTTGDDRALIRDEIIDRIIEIYSEPAEGSR